MGDFNDLLSNREKVGGVPRARWLIEGFWEAVWEAGLSDVAFDGDLFM